MAAHPEGYVEGTDAITLGYLSHETPLDPLNPMADGTVAVTLVAGEFNDDDIILVSDCKDMSLFQKLLPDSGDTGRRQPLRQATQEASDVAYTTGRDRL